MARMQIKYVHTTIKVYNIHKTLTQSFYCDNNLYCGLKNAYTPTIL